NVPICCPNEPKADGASDFRREAKSRSTQTKSRGGLSSMIHHGPRHISLALLLVALAGTAEARFVETRTACQAACPTQVNSFCGGLRPARYRKCRTNTWKVCRRWGIDMICPAPQDPPITTSTTTTTTSTTTVPTIPDLRGSYELDGTVTYDPCDL